MAFDDEEAPRVEEGQAALFSEEEVVPWKAEWQNMPDYSIRDLEPKFQVLINFACAADLEDFGILFGQRIGPGGAKRTASYWFPEQEIGRMVNKRYRAK